MTTELPKIQRIALIATVFTPGAPVSGLRFFAGRRGQLQDVVTAVSQPGYHVGLYGERGVGKTSLANVLAEVFGAADLPQFQSAFITCNTESTYESVWRDIFRELRIVPDDGLAPEDVRYYLARVDPPALIVVDELDRLEDNDSLTRLADTIKSLSDHVVASTLVLVGVARSIGDLIGEHESIARNLQQVQIPRMSERELEEILENGCERTSLAIAPEATTRIVSLSEGLPHYTHLLGFHAATRVVQDDRNRITLGDVEAAIPLAVDKHTIQNDYLVATRSTKTHHLYREVLLACALAPKNELGYFTAGAIRHPLELIAGRKIDIPAFARHLNGFLSPERGTVLQREGEPRNYFYRFRDPVLQPYVVLNGLAEGMITDDQLAALQQEAPATADVRADGPPIEPQQLF